MANKLDVFHGRCLCRILGISWRDHISNEEVMSRTMMENLHDIIQKRQWNFAGHTLRLPQQRPAFTAMTWVLLVGRERQDGQRRPGKAPFRKS